MKKIILLLLVFGVAFSVFGYVYADNDVSEVSVYPIPFRPNGELSQNGTVADGITFANLPSEGEIRIFTKKGELVKKAAFNSGAPAYNWDVKNENGDEVVSGVYVWRIKSGSNSKKGKLIIIR